MKYQESMTKILDWPTIENEMALGISETDPISKLKANALFMIYWAENEAQTRTNSGEGHEELEHATGGDSGSGLIMKVIHESNKKQAKSKEALPEIRYYIIATVRGGIDDYGAIIDDNLPNVPRIYHPFVAHVGG